MAGGVRIDELGELPGPGEMITVLESRSGRCPECNYMLGHNKPHRHGARVYVWADKSAPEYNYVMDEEAREARVQDAKGRALLAEYDRAG